MKLLITGGSGLIGSNLIPLLKPNDITVYTRNVSMAEKILGHKVNFISDLTQLENLDAFDVVINLAGEPIVDKKWTPEQKTVIEQSRWQTTQTLVDLINASQFPPKVFISGSAIGYYGAQGDSPIDESFDNPTDDFSHRLCAKWEDIALSASSKHTRVCVLRTGIVISKRGGALLKMVTPFKLGLGGPIGHGQQYMSWIHLEDMLRGIIHLIENEQTQGVYNFTAPTPVTNQVFSKQLARSLNRPCLFRVPAFVMKLAMGEMATLVVDGQKVLPTRLLESGYKFTYPELSHVFDCLHQV